jgi:hypothetical protein
MSDVPSVSTEPWQLSALDCVVAGAEASAQAASGIWNAMSPEERDRWRETRADYWPRLGLFLQPILDAATRIIQDESQEREQELERAGEEA